MIPELLKKLKESDLNIELVSDLNNLHNQINELIKIDYNNKKNELVLNLKHLSKRSCNHIVKLINELIMKNKLSDTKMDSRISKDKLIKEISIFIEKYYQK